MTSVARPAPLPVTLLLGHRVLVKTSRGMLKFQVVVRETAQFLWTSDVSEDLPVGLLTRFSKMSGRSMTVGRQYQEAQKYRTLETPEDIAWAEAKVAWQNRILELAPKIQAKTSMFLLLRELPPEIVDKLETKFLTTRAARREE